jgi:hypothetical protein
VELKDHACMPMTFGSHPNDFGSTLPQYILQTSFKKWTKAFGYHSQPYMMNCTDSIEGLSASFGWIEM